MKKDIEACAKAVKPAKGAASTPSSPPPTSHLKYQFRKTRDEALQAAVDAVKLARRFALDVEFSAMDASRSDLDYLCRMVEACIKAGATTINLPDTVGYAVPDEYGRMISHDPEQGSQTLKKPFSRFTATTTWDWP